MDTNKILLTVDDIFRMKGVQPGYEPTDLEYEQAVKTAEDLNKKKLESTMMPESAPVVTGGSFTNAEGRVTDYIVKPKGVEVQVLEPKTFNTQQGMFTQVNPTNVAPIIDPRTGQQIMGYAADPMMGGMPSPAPLAGGQMAATNAPTAAPMQTPAPSPTPYPEGATIRGKRDGLLYKVVNGIPQLIPGQ